jgi:hypothetical protein
MTTEREDADLRDARISARYRELAREEPSARLDAAILGAARARAARPGVRRWAVPVSLAAVLVLSVIVTLRIHEEAPDLESGAVSPAEPKTKAATPAPAPAEAKTAGKIATEAPRLLKRSEPKQEPAKPQLRADMAKRSLEEREAAPFATAPAAAPAPAADAQAARPAGQSAAGAVSVPPAAGSSADRMAASRAAPAPAPMAARERSEPAAFEESPEKWLEHIARLRGEGRDADADESLARFRRRYPDYRIPEAMRAKVLPR